MSDHCKTCRWWKSKVSKGSTDGECHRYAPKPLVGGSGTDWTDWAWPKVMNFDFCGEHDKEPTP